MLNYSEEYKAAIENSLSAFVNDGDEVICVGYFAMPSGQCEMCEHKPIKWHYILENLRSGQNLIVGSECVGNYQVILTGWGYKPEQIVFPKRLSPYTRWILEKNPGAILFNDGIVMRMTTDCDPIIQAKKKAGNLQHSGYVKPTTSGNSRYLRIVRESKQKSPVEDQHFPNDSEHNDDPWFDCMAESESSSGDDSWIGFVFGSRAEYEEWADNYEG